MIYLVHLNVDIFLDEGISILVKPLIFIKKINYHLKFVNNNAYILRLILGYIALTLFICCM